MNLRPAIYRIIGMKRNLGYVVLGIVAYLGFLAATFPAERAFSAMRERMQGVYVQGVSGSVWNGHANTLQFKDQTFDDFDWRLRVLPLLIGRLEIGFEFDGGDRIGTGVAALGADGSLGFKDVDVRLPMADVDQYLGLGPLGLSGTVALQFETASFEQSRLKTAIGTLRWQQAALPGTPPLDMGNFELTLSDDEGGVKGVVKDTGGPVQLEGNVRLQQDGSYQFTGNISARANAAPALAQALRLMGAPGPDGKIRLQYRGSL